MNSEDRIVHDGKCTKDPHPFNAICLLLPQSEIYTNAAEEYAKKHVIAVRQLKHRGG
jgi:hypothetical protein